MKARLILENGIEFEGSLFGAAANAVGEIVFTTGTTGYQEEITDPSFAGQLVTMTFPLIGNYGINLDDMESRKPALNALIVREKCNHPSNFRNELSLDDYLAQQGVTGIEGIDTRALTRIIRDNGTMKGVIAADGTSDEEIKRLFDSLDNSDVIMRTTTESTYVINPTGKIKVAYIDIGTKDGILRCLKDRDCCITVYRADVSADEIIAANPDFVFVSNGPGNPEDAPGTIDTVKSLIGKFPIFGICTGHHIIGLALGCSSEKMKHGHHGGNHPVKDLATGSVYITSQAHNYTLCNFPADVEETFVNVNDGSCEGIRHKTLPIQSVQFHPEAAPGPRETGFMFDRFLEEVK